MLYQELDVVYWLLMISSLPNVLASPFALLFDVVLFAAALAAIIWPRKRTGPLLFFVVYSFYFVLYNSVSGHHYVYMLGVLFTNFAFVFAKPERFGATLLFCRFIFLFVFGSAGLWKLFRGNLTHPPQMRHTLVEMNITALTSGEDSFRLEVVQWLLAHQGWAHFIWIVMIVLELFFLLGYFSLKWDRLILACYLFFAGGAFFLFQVLQFENLFFLVTLWPVLVLFRRKQTAKIETRKPGYA